MISRRSALRSRRQRGKQFLGVGLRHSQIPNGPAQKVEILNRSSSMSFCSSVKA